MASLTYGKCNLCQTNGMWKNLKHMMADETEAIKMQITM